MAYERNAKSRRRPLRARARSAKISVRSELGGFHPWRNASSTRVTTQSVALSFETTRAIAKAAQRILSNRTSRPVPWSVQLPSTRNRLVSAIS